MRNPRATSWRNWSHAGTLAAVVAGATALAPASELENVGYASRPGRANSAAEAVPAEDVQARIDATLPIVDDEDLSAATDPIQRPMYRLPAIEEMSEAALEETATAPTTEQFVEPAEEAAEAEPPATLPTITILPPIDTPPDMTLEDGATGDAVTEEVAEEPESARPTITILPPVEVDASEEDIEDRTPTAPTITILPPVEAPMVSAAEPVSPADSDEVWEADERITDEFDAAWNDGDSPEAEAPSPETETAPRLPVMLPTRPPLTMPPNIEEPEPQYQYVEPPAPQFEPVAAPQAHFAPQQVAPPQITPYTPTTAELSRQLLPSVQQAYRLAQQGAVYAAQAEFIRVLRRIAEAKDSAGRTDTHSRALAAGLRAIDEADDFAPIGTALEADINVARIASAHRTPVLQGETASADRVRPAVAVALYHEFARAQLARAVAGEQAGSMALHGLGKVHQRLARGNQGQLQHERTALAMFAAALDAGPTNHLAANEIGVLLSRAGYPAEASQMFRHAIDLAPTSTAYHNLAMTDRALGYHEQSAANERYALALAQRDRAANAASRSRGVAWVAPQELSRMAQPMPIEMQHQPRMAASPPPNMVQPVGGPARSGAETASKWPKKLIPGSFWR